MGNEQTSSIHNGPFGVDGQMNGELWSKRGMYHAPGGDIASSSTNKQSVAETERKPKRKHNRKHKHNRKPNTAALHPETGIHQLNGDVLRRVVVNLKPIDIRNFLIAHRPVGEVLSTVAMHSMEMDSDQVQSLYEVSLKFISILIVTVGCSAENVMLMERPEYDFHNSFPNLQHFVLKSPPRGQYNRFFTCNTDQDFLLLKKAATDWSATNLVSIDMTDVSEDYYEHAESLLTEMLQHSTPKLEMVRMNNNVFDMNNYMMMTNVHSLFILVENDTTEEGSTQLEGLWKWATATDTRERTLHIEFRNWDYHAQNLMETNTDQMELARRSNKRSGLAYFTLSVCVYPYGDEDEEDMIEKLNEWENTLEVFINQTTKVTLQFKLVIGNGYAFSSLLLQKMMLYTTTKSENVDINITIAADEHTEATPQNQNQAIDAIRWFCYNLHDVNGTLRNVHVNVQLENNGFHPLQI